MLTAEVLIRTFSKAPGTTSGTYTYVFKVDSGVIRSLYCTATYVDLPMSFHARISFFPKIQNGKITGYDGTLTCDAGTFPVYAQATDTPEEMAAAYQLTLTQQPVQQ